MESVDRLFRRYPGPLIGVPTGEVSGFDALDIDPRSGGNDWLAAHAHQLLGTRRHETRSGGLHILYRHLDGMRNTASKIAPGVDTRGEGGFIIYWPAHGGRVEHADTILDWPTWLYDAVTYVRPPPIYPKTTTVKARTALIERVIGNALYRLETAPLGQKHYQLRAASCTIGGVLDVSGIPEEQAFAALVSAAVRAGAVDQKNAEKTARWGLHRGRQTPLHFGAVGDGG